MPNDYIELIKGLLGSTAAQQYANALNTEQQEPTAPASYTPNFLSQQVEAAEAKANQAANQAVQQAAQITAPQERLPTKDQIDDSVLQHTTGQKLATSLAPPNPFLVDNQRSVLLNKAMYESAPEGEKGDALRQQASQSANLTREQLEAAGYDTSSFGANNATARDMAQQLDSDRARAILETTMPNGKYFRTADDYYRDSYYEHLALGYSPRQARKFAGNRAKEYQAERVGYLRAAYETYGHEGGVTNNYGVNWLASMGQENPALANFFGALYPTPKDQYDRQNKLQDKFIDQAGQIAQLSLNHQYGFANRADAARWNAYQALLQGDIEKALTILRHGLTEQGKDTQLTRDKEFARFTTDEDIYKHYKTVGINFDDFKNRAEFTRKLKELEPSDIRKAWNGYYEACRLEGMTDEEARKAASNMLGQQIINSLQPKNAQSSKGNAEANGEPKYSDITARINSIQSQIEKETSALGYEEDPEAQERVRKLREELEDLNTRWNDKADNTEGTAKIRFDPKNEANNIALVNAFWEEGRKQGFSDEQIKQRIHDVVLEHTNNEELANRLAEVGMH